MTYSVQVVRRVLFAERRNFPFSTSKAENFATQVSRKKFNISANKAFLKLNAPWKHEKQQEVVSPEHFGTQHREEYVLERNAYRD